MRTIGLIGGMSWESTLTYYRVVNEEVRRRRGGHHGADLVLVSLDFARVRELQQAEDWDGAGALLADAARRVRAAGAEVVGLATNLMHKVAPALEAALAQCPGDPPSGREPRAVEFLHIADAVGARARALGAGTVGLLAARWVMEEDFYAARLRERWGVDVVVPGPEERALVDRVIFDELTRDRVVEASRAAFARIADGLAARGAGAVALACTEIGLLLRPGDVEVPLVDSALAHAVGLVDRAVG